MHAHLKAPDLPGVYLFINAQGHVLYVGKAVSLKKRIASHFQSPATFDAKHTALIAAHERIDYLVTRSEYDALIIEEYLIKRYQPPFNVLLKSGNPFLYLLFTPPPHESCELVRDTKKQGTYIGPFVQKQAARRLYHYLLRTFRLYRCSQTITAGCLKYHLGICAGTCMPTFSVDEYRARLALAQQALREDRSTFLSEIHDQEQRAQVELNFEYARQLHEYRTTIEEIFATVRRTSTVARYRKEIQAHEERHVAQATRVLIAEHARAHEQLQVLLKHPQPIITIDCFDISHHQSHALVGSAVRFHQGLPDAHALQSFRITTLTQQNDYAALQEIIQRRYRDPDRIPDLILIDGGKGQRSAAQAVAPATVPVISLAKREERLFTDLHPDGILLDVGTPIGKLLISLRDYAHHRAIRYHTQRRHRAAFQK